MGRQHKEASALKVSSLASESVRFTQNQLHLQVISDTLDHPEQTLNTAGGRGGLGVPTTTLRLAPLCLLRPLPCVQDKAAQALAEVKEDRDKLASEKQKLRADSAEAQTLAQVVAREKLVVEKTKQRLREEAEELERRQSRLEGISETGKASLEEARKELRLAAQGLEREKITLDAERKVRDMRNTRGIILWWQNYE